MGEEDDEEETSPSPSSSGSASGGASGGAIARSSSSDATRNHLFADSLLLDGCRTSHDSVCSSNDHGNANDVGIFLRHACVCNHGLHHWHDHRLQPLHYWCSCLIRHA